MLYAHFEQLQAVFNHFNSFLVVTANPPTKPTVKHLYLNIFTMSPSNKKQSKTKSAKCATKTMSSPLLSTPLTGTDYITSFATFISLANLSDIKHFCEAAGSSQEGINLKFFWEHVFAEGKKVGQEEEYNQGYNAGYNEGYSDACKKDYEAGLGANSSVSTTEIGTQVNLPPPNFMYQCLSTDCH